MHRTSIPDRPARRLPDRARLAAQALVLSLVVAGTSAFTMLHKTVTLDVDGSVSTVSAFGRTVSDVLDARGVPVAADDVVVPAPHEAVRDQEHIVVRHGPGPRDAAVRTSASRSAAPARGELLEVSTPTSVHVVVDGRAQELTTTAGTVRDALAEAGVVLGEHDRVSVPLAAAAVDGLMVLVTRVETTTRSEATDLPFATVEQQDPALPEGRRVVSVAGRDGARVVTYRAHLAGGVEVDRTVLAESVIREPVDEVVRVGTGADLSRVAPVEPGTSRAIGLELTLDRGWDEAQFGCLDKLWSKESGWRVDAHNSSSGAHGIPQALPGSKMASAGDDWATNPQTQIAWGLGYIENRYGTPCAAWAHSQARNWY